MGKDGFSGQCRRSGWLDLRASPIGTHGVFMFGVFVLRFEICSLLVKIEQYVKSWLLLCHWLLLLSFLVLMISALLLRIQYLQFNALILIHHTIVLHSDGNNAAANRDMDTSSCSTSCHTVSSAFFGWRLKQCCSILVWVVSCERGCASIDEYHACFTAI